MWGAFFASLIVLALFFDAKALAVTLFAVGLLYVGGGKLVEIAFTNLHVRRDSPRSYYFPGEQATVTIHFENRSIIPIAWLWGYDRIPNQLLHGKVRRWALSIPPKSTVSTSYTVTTTRRGVYTVGAIELTMGDPLGFHQRRGTTHSYHDIVVYPQIVPLESLNLPSNLPIGNVRPRRRIYPDPSRLAGVRAYQPGDPKQWIHWKVTARRGAYHVKQFEHTVALDTVIVLNFNEDDYRVGVRWLDSELAITLAAALAAELAKMREPFGFVTNASLHYHESSNRIRKERTSADRIVRIPSRKGSGQLMRVLEVLAAAECEPCTDFVEMLGNEARRFDWGSTLLVITPVDSEDLVNTAFQLVSGGHRVLLFITGERLRHGHLLHHSPHPGLHVYHARRESLQPLVLEGGGVIGS